MVLGSEDGSLKNMPEGGAEVFFGFLNIFGQQPLYQGLHGRMRTVSSVLLGRSQACFCDTLFGDME